MTDDSQPGDTMELSDPTDPRSPVLFKRASGEVFRELPYYEVRIRRARRHWEAQKPAMPAICLGRRLTEPTAGDPETVAFLTYMNSHRFRQPSSFDGKVWAFHLA
jgi:hypothetical protein